MNSTGTAVRRKSGASPGPSGPLIGAAGALEGLYERPARTPASEQELEAWLEASNRPGSTTVDQYMNTRLLHLAGAEWNMSDPAYVGHMAPPIPDYMPAIAASLAAINANVVKVETAKAFTKLERQVSAQLHSLFYQRPVSPAETYDPARTHAILTGGGTVANETALWLAKNSLLDDARSNLKSSLDGMDAALRGRGYQGARIITSRLAHYSMFKIADIMGIGERGLIQLPVDTNGCLSTSDLGAAIAECREQRYAILAVVAMAGATETGSVDDLAAIGRICSREQIHLHVDAAFGGAAAFSARYGHLLRGIENADTITLCAQKALRCPLGLSAVIIKNPLQAAVIEKSSRYIIRKGSADLGRRSAEGSRPANVVFLDARLQIDGPHRLGEEIDYSIDLARRFAERIEARPEFQLIAAPTMQILNYVYLPAHCRAGGLTEQNAAEVSRYTRLIQRRMERSFVSRTTLSHAGPFDVDVFRVVLLNPQTGIGTLEAMLDEQIAAAEKIAAMSGLEDDAEASLAAQHAGVGFGGAFERVELVHGADAGLEGEVQGVL